MAGDATEVGSIVAYLILNRADWEAGVRATERDADKLGRLSPNIRIDTNADQVILQLAAVDAATRKVADSSAKAKAPVVGLWGALAAISPAAVPIAAVVGGALIGLLPVVASLYLGIKGISAQMQSGALDGSQYATQIGNLKDEFRSLQQIAAHGLIGGVEQALSSTAPLFTTVNQDVAVMSAQLGHIVAAVAPGLVRMFTQLNPLFVTFGNLLVSGAQRFDLWTQKTNGVQGFVAYVQVHLPQVTQFLGNLITLISHLLQAAANVGPVMLTGFGALVRVLNAIPINVLQILVPLVIAAYAAFKTYATVTFLVQKVNDALDAHAAKVAASAAAASAAAMQEQAAAAQVTAAELDKAATTAEAEARIAASLRATGVVLVGQAQADADAAITFAEAERAKAVAAAESAAVITKQAKKATAGVAATAETGALGLTRFLGPLAAVGVGVSLLTGLFSGNSKQQQENQKIADSYAQSLQQDANALAQVNIATTTKNLQDSNSFALLDKIVAGNKNLGITYSQLSVAVNGTDAQYQSLVNRLADAGKAGDTQFNQTTSLIEKLATLREALTKQEKLQLQLAQAQHDAQVAVDGGTTAVARQAATFGVTTDVYLAAQTALAKWGDQQAQAAVQAEVMSRAVSNVADALMGTRDGFDANTLSGAAFAKALDTFAKSAGTVEDHAALVGAGLVALQGDALGVASAAAQATAANDALTGAFEQQAQTLANQQGQQAAAAGSADNAARSVQNAAARLQQAESRLQALQASGRATATQLAAAEASVANARNSSANAAQNAATANAKLSASGGLDYAATERAAIALTKVKNGWQAVIDTTKEGAAPLIQQLQAMQAAAEKNAEATYQTVYASEKNKSAFDRARDAAAAAANVFKTDTFTALVNDATQLGLTTEQAKALATTYFNMPKDFSTKAQLLGTADVVNVLNQIGEQLSYLTGHPWVSTVNADTTQADTKISNVSDKLGNLTRKGYNVNVDAYVDPALAKIAAVNAALSALISRSAAATPGGQLAEKGYTTNPSTGSGYGAAGGGTVIGPGTSKSDSIIAAILGGGTMRLSRGEEVIQEPYASLYRPLLKAINNGHFATPKLTMPAPATSAASVSGAAGAAVGAGNYVDKLQVVLQYPAPADNPENAVRLGLKAAGVRIGSR